MPITSTATPRHQQSTNVSRAERVISIVGGGVLVGYGLRNRSWGGAAMAALGGALALRGATGHCSAYQALGITTNQRGRGRNASVPYELGIRVDAEVVINKPRHELYRFWRNLENLPRFMRHLETVKEIDNKRSHWVAKAPAGRSVQWTAEIINEMADELIGWRTLPGADVDNAGSVRFKDAPHGGTVVQVALQYNPPGGAVGAMFAKLFGEEPSQQIRKDLERFRSLMETGEIPCADGRPEKKAVSASASAKGWKRDQVTEASEESFPASDPPSWTAEALTH